VVDVPNPPEEDPKPDDPKPDDPLLEEDPVV
jgi:hypothetical protein